MDCRSCQGLTPELYARLTAQLRLSPDPREQITVAAPFTGAALAAIPACRAEDVEWAATRARAAHPAWAQRSFRERARIFLRFHDLLLQRQCEVLDLIQIETGKARRHAFEEVLDTAVVARYYAWRAGKFLRPRRRKGALPLLTR